MSIIKTDRPSHWVSIFHLFLESYETQMHCVRKVKSFLLLNQGVRMLLTG